MIRECEEKDLETLERFLPTGLNRAHESHFRRQQEGQWSLLVAWIDEIPRGTCVISWTGPLHDDIRAALPDCPEVCFVQVAPEARNQGIGTALIDAAEQRILARGSRSVGMGVSTTNQDAHRLYARLGYRETGLVAVTEYSIWTEAGVKQDLVEADDFLVKELG